MFVCACVCVCVHTYVRACKCVGKYVNIVEWVAARVPEPVCEYTREECECIQMGEYSMYSTCKDECVCMWVVCVFSEKMIFCQLVIWGRHLCYGVDLSNDV